jgi:uncharacterized protein (DUF302 family)
MKKMLAKKMMGDIVFKKSVKASFEKVEKALEAAIKKNNFSIPTIHDLKKTFQKAELPLAEDFNYKIVQLCNAKKSHKALTTMSYDMGIMMPKSIIIAQEGEKVTLRFMKMKPWMVGMMFPEIDIAPMSKNVMKILEKIVNDTVDNLK